MTPYNREKFIKRGYDIAHGNRATLPESEIAALEIIQHFKNGAVQIPVNYCSYVYKNRFQKSGLRHKLAPSTLNAWEDITENGYVRNLSIDLIKYPGAHKTIDTLLQTQPDGVFLDEALGRLFFRLDQMSKIPDNVPLELGYRDVRISEKLRNIPDFEPVILNMKRKLYVETAFVLNDKEITPALRQVFLRIATGVALPEEWQATEQLHWIAHFENIEEGLEVYY